MGEKHRDDVPQGEKLEEGAQQSDAVGADVLSLFLELPPVCRVLLPPAIEPGQGETRVREVDDDVDRGFEVLGRSLEEEKIPSCPEGQKHPGLDIDTVDEAEVDLRE